MCTDSYDVICFSPFQEQLFFRCYYYHQVSSVDYQGSVLFQGLLSKYGFCSSGSPAELIRYHLPTFLRILYVTNESYNIKKILDNDQNFFHCKTYKQKVLI